MNILGIDPGLHGAWAIVGPTMRITDIDDLPIIGAGKQTRLDGGAMADHWRCLDVSLAVIEAVHSMPRQGVSSSFKFGYACGQILGVIEGLNIPVEFVTPQMWKKHFRLSADKEDARKRAIETFPHDRASFARKRDHGRAEAALIALWGAVKHEAGTSIREPLREAAE